MEKYSNSEFEKIVNDIKNRFGGSIFNHWNNDQDIDALLENIEPDELIKIKEVIKKYRKQSFDEQFR